MIEIIKDKADIEEYFKVLKKRGAVNSGQYYNTAKTIVDNVLANGDKAIIEYTTKFDDPNFKLEDVEISREEQKKAFDSLDEKMRNVLTRAYERIYKYHKHQLRTTWMYEEDDGEKLGQKITPIAKIGVYVPGGTAVYPSSVLMNIVPAKVAGVKSITMVTPCVRGFMNPAVLACAYICGVDHVYKIGGAQAIAALAYGTETIAPVDKIVGPGNIYVALAKREVYGTVGIDSIAGPSEICIIADKTAKVNFVAADLLGQAEHDAIASSTLLITDYDLAVKIKNKTEEYYKEATRKEILDESLTNCSKIIVVDSVEEAIAYSNRIAPEHLELAMDNAMDYVDKVENAGAIFIGHYSPEALGDYMAGPNHILPTVSTARFFSPLGVDDFIKKSSLICFTKEATLKLVDDVDTFAQAEGLAMHALSARVRKEN